MREGGICKEVAFVASGLLRTFYIDAKGDEVTYCITFPGNMITAYSSFITGNRTVENIQAIDTTQVVTIKKQAIDELSHNNLNWTRFLKVMAEHEYMELEQRIFQLQKHEAAERYRNLLKNRPEYIKQIPLQYLASYLGITQRHLSRIRKEVLDKCPEAGNLALLLLAKSSMSKKILIINGHPDSFSFNFAISEAYRQGAIEAGAEVQDINIADLDFDHNLRYGYKQRIELEPDLLAAWEKIKWADHLVWVHPVWWGGLPAITKGFIDRLFLPGMAFQYRPNSLWWDKLLTGKTARIITTLDQPGWYYRLIYARPSVNQLKRSTLQFCGVSPVKVTYVGIIKGSDDTRRQKWLKQVALLGQKQK